MLFFMWVLIWLSVPGVVIFYAVFGARDSGKKEFSHMGREAAGTGEREMQGSADKAGRRGIVSAAGTGEREMQGPADKTGRREMQGPADKICRRGIVSASSKTSKPCFICRYCMLLAVLCLVFSISCGCGSRASEPVLEAVTGDGKALDSFGNSENSGNSGEENASSDMKKTDGDGASDSKGSREAEKYAKSEGVSGAQGVSETGESSNAQDGAGSEAGPGAGDSLKDSSKAEGSSAAEKLPTAEGFTDIVTVHVCGAVKKEGVYTLSAGSRIRDAIEAAGGFNSKADTSYLNLAMKLEDSWQIRVPTAEEAEKLREQSGGGQQVDSAVTGGVGNVRGITKGSAEGDAADSEGNSSGSGEERKININTASAEELTGIPGIGESKAKKIIEYREQNGRFEVIEDIMNITGIKENSFRKMRDYITVDG